jgi:predicted naringenin-chalcone synthase
VPRIIGREIEAVTLDLFGGTAAVDAWAVHPGGRSILDRVEDGLGLDPAALADSRDVLREYGNMSSATILFVLRRMLEHDRHEGERLAVLAFGPGLTIEAARMSVRGVATPADAVRDLVSGATGR